MDGQKNNCQSCNKIRPNLPVGCPLYRFALPFAFAFALAFAFVLVFLVVIPEGDLLLLFVL
jgi:hypothetical protein